MIKHTPLIQIGLVSQRSDGVMFGITVRFGRGPLFALGFCKPWNLKQMQVPRRPFVSWLRKMLLDWDSKEHYFTALYGVLRGFIIL